MLQLKSAEAFFKTFTMNRINKMIYKVNTPAEAKKVELPTLTNILEQYGQVKAEAYIKLSMLDLLANINVGDSFTKVHIDTLGNYIVELYSHLSLADVGLVLKRGKQGFYGPLYGRLDVPTVMIWFAEYEKERTKNMTPY